MKFVVASDSYKESCTAKEASLAMEKGIKRVFPKANVVHAPMADGGEGTTQALVESTNGKYVTKEVQDPLGNTIKADIGVLGDGKTAVIEMANASGIHLVPKEKRNPLSTSTFGTGELIKHCLDMGINHIILGIGGSATNDGGMGMAKALGVRFLNSSGESLSEGGGQLGDLSKIDISNIDSRLKDSLISVASDVSNPLCGSNGASNVFGPQKGATPEVIKELDENLQHYDSIIQKDLNKNIGEIPGSGAAGGLGAGLIAFTNCELQPGIELVTEYAGLKEKLADADYCFTGEGQIDFQTKFGKTPYGVMKAAKEVDEDIKVVAIAGSVGEGVEELYEEGFDGVFSTIPEPQSLDELLANGEENITKTVESICRLIK